MAKKQGNPSRTRPVVRAALAGVLALGVAGCLADGGASVTAAPAPPTPTVAVPLADAPVATGATATATRTAEPGRTTRPTGPAKATRTAKPGKPARTGTAEPRRTTAKPKPKPRKTATEKPSRDCDPNYAGACVPVADDVDCGGGSGNGPEYLYGTARVVGDDVYDLDRDSDGIACEKS